MAVAFDAVGPGATGATGPTSPLTFTHVCGASATHLLVGATWDGATDTGATMSATYNTVAMTSLGVWHTGGGTAGFLQVWYLASPATGSHSVQVTATNSPAGINAGSISFTGSAGLSAVQSAVSSGTATNPTLTFTGTTSGNMVAAFSGSGSTVTQAGSFTQRYNVTGGSGSAGAGFTAGATIASPGGSTTANWTMVADFWAVAAVEVQAAAVAAAPVSLPEPEIPPGITPMGFRFATRPQSPVAPGPVTIAATAALTGTGTLNASPGKKYIAGIGGTAGASYWTDQAGQPIMYLADNPWGLPPNAGAYNGGNWQLEYDNYCNSRGTQGFTGCYTDPLGNTINGGTYADGRTWDGVTPFVTGTDPSSGLNNTFWTRIDYFLNAALRNGITVFLNIGYNTDMASGGALYNKTSTQYQNWGANLAARYAAQPNIVWVVGNDYQATAWDSAYSSMLTGLRGGGDTHPITIHYAAEMTSRYATDTNASQPWGVSNAQANWVYTYIQTYWCTEYAYTETSHGASALLGPIVWGDGYFYTGTAAGDRAVRQDTWWALSSGARGCTTGSEGIWQWASTAPAAVTSENWYANVAGKVRTAVEALPGWHQLIPDTSSVLVTAGRGTRGSGTTSGGGGTVYGEATTDAYVTASRTPDPGGGSTLALIYLSHATTITIDQTKMAAGYTATWIDPASGATSSATTGATYNSGTKGNNSAGTADWVLALQGPTIVSGAAAITGAGTLAVTATQQAPAAVTGAGTLAAAAVQGSGAALAGTGTLAAAVTQQAGAVITGAGTLAAAVTQQATATVTGSGTLAVTATQATAPVITGTGTLAAPATLQAGAAVTGAGALAASAGGAVSGTATLTGAGTLAAAAVQGSGAALAGTGTLTAPAVQQAAAALAGTGTLASPATLQAPAAIGGAGTLAAAVTQAAAATAASAGAVTTLATQQAAAALAGTGTLAASAGGAASGTAAITGAGTLTTAATIIAPAPLTGAGTLTAPAVQAAPAAATGTGTLAAAVTQLATAPLTGTGTLTAASAQQATAPLAGNGTLAAAAAQRATAPLTGTGTLAAAGGAYTFAGAALTGTGTLAAAGTVSTITGAALAGTGTLTTTARQAATAAAAGTGILTAAAAQAAPAAITGTGALTVVATQRGPFTIGILTTADRGTVNGTTTTAAAALTTATTTGGPS